MDKMQKKRLKRNRTKFGRKKHAFGGIVSSSLVGISFLTFCILVIVAFKKQGNAGLYLGTIGLTSIVFNLTGFVMGVSSFKEKEKSYFYSKLGVILNGIMLFGWCIVYLEGM